MLIKQKHFFFKEFLNQDKNKIFLKQEKVSVNEVRKDIVFPLNFVYSSPFFFTPFADFSLWF